MDGTHYLPPSHVMPGMYHGGPPPPPPSMLDPTIPPNQTLYVNNLNEKMKKEELKSQIYMLFSAYGQILDVVVYKSLLMRGQAFIVFKDIGQAASALRALQRFPFFGKPLQINYAKTKSDAVADIEGHLADHQRERRDRKAQRIAEEAAHPKVKKEKRQKIEAPQQPVVEVLTNAQLEDQLPPHKVLFVQRLPSSTTEAALVQLFSQHAGFTEVRTVPGKPDIAFVEFENEALAAEVRQALQAFELVPEHPMRIVFGRK
jgi:RNA recognition motif-containing protein